MNAEPTGKTDGCEPELSAAELWTLLKQQQAEIAAQNARIADLARRLDIAGERIAVLPDASAKTRATNGASPGNGNGQHPAPAQPAPRRRGWRIRSGHKVSSPPTQQKVLPKAVDTTPAAIERRLSRAGLLKAAAAGVAGVAAVETADTIEAPHAAAAGGELEYHSYLASDANVPPHPEIGFRTEITSYDYGAYMKGNKAGVVGQGIRPPGSTQGGTGVAGRATTDQSGQTLSSGIGVWGESGSGIGVRGTTYFTRRLTPSVEVGGTGVQGESVGGSGVAGQSMTKPGIGVLGFDTANTGIGVAGTSFTDSSQQSWGAGTGVLGRGHFGVKGEAFTNTGYAVYGTNKGFLGTAIYGESLTPQGGPGHGYGVYGHTGDGYGVYGRSVSLTREGAAGEGVGVYGESGTDAGVAGESGTGAGVFGITTGNTGFGVEGISYATPGRGSLGNGVGVKGKSNGVGVWGESAGYQATGIYGIQTANSGTGVAGRSYADSTQNSLGNGTGVWGDTGSGKGVLGTALTGDAVHGSSTYGTGVVGESFVGAGTGVKGTAASGRGGVFSGGAAQLQLVPSSAAHPPTSGQKGDLFLDSLARLWLCTAGGATAVWVTMGAGGGGGTGPIVAHSTLAGTPGVLADNNSNDPNSVGVSASSLDGSGNPGAGYGLKGLTGSGTAVSGTSRDASNALSSGTGVEGSSGYGLGVKGWALSGFGVVGASYTDQTQTQKGYGTGVLGTSGSGTGVRGAAGSGRGGVFSGGAAQLQMVPAAGAVPASGQDGDLFLDSSKQLWLCTAGGNQATWQQLGSGGGGGGGTGPVVAHSTVIATPGVWATNNTNDPASIGVLGASVDSSGNPGLGIGVWGDTGGGIAVRGNAGTLGYAGVFSGGKAQLQLVPRNGNRPATGAAGDLVVDSSNQLWFCQGGSQWVQLAPSSGGPLAGHSTVAGTPGMLGDNNSNDVASIGVSGASIDGQGNPGQGIGVQGSAGNGNGVEGWATSGYGVHGISYADSTQSQKGYGTGVFGESGSGIGVSGYSASGTGVKAASGQGSAVYASSSGGANPTVSAANDSGGTAVSGVVTGGGTGVYGQSDSGTAIYGYCGSGRGAWLAGGAAQLRLQPGTSHPTIGIRGDLYMDSTCTLWICTADNDSTAWRQVQVV